MNGNVTLATEKWPSYDDPEWDKWAEGALEDFAKQLLAEAIKRMGGSAAEEKKIDPIESMKIVVKLINTAGEDLPSALDTLELAASSCVLSMSGNNQELASTYFNMLKAFRKEHTGELTHDFQVELDKNGR